MNSRNGYRTREWNTRAGTMELALPRLRHGSNFPSFLEQRRRAERALAEVVATSYLHGSCWPCFATGGAARSGPPRAWPGFGYGARNPAPGAACPAAGQVPARPARAAEGDAGAAVDPVQGTAARCRWPLPAGS